MKLGKNLKINLFASEEKFPELANPVQMAWDNKGRLWVAVMPSYPHWKPKEEMNDKIIILEDTDGDGVADKCTVWADKLHVPTGLEFWNGGLLLGQQPDLMFLKDTNGGGKANYRERVLHGIDSADTHHALNSFVIDGGGALYFQEGTFHHTQVETPYGPPVRNANAGAYRYEPRTGKFETYVNYGFANPHGHVFERWGQDFITDGTGNQNYVRRPFSGVSMDYLEFRHAGFKAFFGQQKEPAVCSGNEILSQPAHFPDRSIREITWNANVNQAVPGHLSLRHEGRGLRLHRRAKRQACTTAKNDHLDRLPPIRTSCSVRTSKWAPTAPFTSAIGTTRSSATCSTTCAIRIAIAPMAASYRITYDGRPAVEVAWQDRRGDDPRIARRFEKPRGPRPLSRPSGVVGAPHRRRAQGDQ